MYAETTGSWEMRNTNATSTPRYIKQKELKLDILIAIERLANTTIYQRT